MKSALLLFFVILLILKADCLLHRTKPNITTDNRIFATVKIYSNLAEIITPLSKLPLEFSAEDWSDIRSDSVTLVGANVTVTQQSITEKKKSLNNAQVYVKSPSSTSTKTEFVKATMIDERRNLVKLTDKDVSKEPIYLTVSSDQIVYDNEPPQSKYYVNFTYDTSDAVYVSYLRSNLNWKTRYQLNLFEDAKKSVLISMADIRNDGQSKIDIEHAELLGGDINLKMQDEGYWRSYQAMPQANMYGMAGVPHADSFKKTQGPSISQAEEIAGLYVFTINQPFSIDAKTNYLLSMFRPQVTIERYASISKHFYGSGEGASGKAQRSYRLSSDQFLSRGNCIIRESDRLVGETSLPNLAAKDKHEFSIGQDADVIYKENATLVSSYTFNKTDSPYGTVQSQTRLTYDITVLLKNFKKNRPVKIEYEQHVYGTSIKLLTSTTDLTQESSKIKYKTTIPANDEKVLSYKIEISN